jgi:hypothetical protein
MRSLLGWHKQGKRSNTSERKIRRPRNRLLQRPSRPLHPPSAPRSRLKLDTRLPGQDARHRQNLERRLVKLPEATNPHITVRQAHHPALQAIAAPCRKRLLSPFIWSCRDDCDIERMPTDRGEVRSMMTEMPVIISRADKYPTPNRTYPSSCASSVEAVDPHSTLVEEA